MTPIISDKNVKIKNARILIVEDEGIVALEIERELTYLGYTVVGNASNGEKAIELAREKNPNLILMDIRLQKSMDGIETATIIRKEQDIPIVFLTAYADDETVERAKPVQPFGYILKPFETRELHVVVEMALYKHHLDQRLRIQEHRFRKIYEDSPIGIQLFDARGNLRDVNEACINIFGIDTKARQKRYNIYKDPNFDPELLEKIKGQKQCRIEVEYNFNKIKELNLYPTLKTGKAYLLILVTPLGFDNDKNKSDFLTHTQDITAQKKAEKDLEKERDLLQVLMDNIPDSIYFKNKKSQFIRISRNQSKKFKMKDATEAIGKSDFDVFSIEHAQQAYDDEQKIMKTGEPLIEVEERETWQDGSVTWVSTSKVPMLDANRKVTGLVGISRNITKRKIAEQKLKETAIELKRSNEELEQFAYVASHDLQEPLRMVASYVQLLEKRYNDQLDDDAKEFIHYAVDGAKRMQGLINDLLVYSRVGTRGKEFELTDCNQIVQRVQNDLTIAIQESNAKIKVDPLPEVVADSLQLGQLFQNLISNAIKFRGDKSPEIEVHVEEKNDEYTFSVKDNGIGIDEQYANRIFMVFQRLHTRDEYPGSGIGLAVCKKIVERHGGHIHVESKEGEGATFYFSIPKKGE